MAGARGERPRSSRWTAANLVAVILAASIGIAINLFIVTAGVEAFLAPSGLPIGLSDNATQVLTGWGGGIIGIVGALVGMNVGARRREPPPEPDDDEESMS